MANIKATKTSTAGRIGWFMRFRSFMATTVIALGASATATWRVLGGPNYPQVGPGAVRHPPALSTAKLDWSSGVIDWATTPRVG